MLYLDLERRVQRRFGDSGFVTVTSADIIDWTNDGQLQIARDTKCMSTSLTQAANTFPVAIPTDLMRVERMTYGGMPITYVDTEELDGKYTDLSIVDAPILWYRTLGNIALYPKAASTDTTSVIITYSKIPTTIVVNSDPLTIPVRYHVDLVAYCLMRAHERNENWNGMDRMMAEFQKGLAERVEEWNEPDDSYFVKRDDAWDNQVMVNNGW